MCHSLCNIVALLYSSNRKNLGSNNLLLPTYCKEKKKKNLLQKFRKTKRILLRVTIFYFLNIALWFVFFFFGKYDEYYKTK
jgi:hypothetical protein